ncbi:hypothetical protein GCM10011341_38130 [Frigidibacter albus]|nr:hypothetical protein GCM10011341_38130 [Frigidibacter albus]
MATDSAYFESITTAGRSARLLSVISKEKQTTVDAERLSALAQTLGIRKHELRGLLHELSEQGTVDVSENGGVSVLGVTQRSLLSHATEIFKSQKPSGLEQAALDLAERGSRAPVKRSDCEQEISDTYRLSISQLSDLFSQSEQIGFTDYEGAGEDRLYFNGSLFRRDQAKKAKYLLENMSPQDQQRLHEAEALMQSRGCVQAGELRRVLGDQLWRNLHQIGFFEVSTVTNEHGQTEFVTKPEAISKFMPCGLADMLDDAKALSASLTYGIVKSSSSRGRVNNPSALMDRLIYRGYVEGWAEALKEDYKILERRGVVTVTQSDRGYRLTLDKPEIGQMAKALILKGDAIQVVAEAAVGNTAYQFGGPESSRQAERKKTVSEPSSGVSRSLNVLRRR